MLSLHLNSSNAIQITGRNRFVTFPARGHDKLMFWPAGECELFVPALTPLLPLNFLHELFLRVMYLQ